MTASEDAGHVIESKRARRGTWEPSRAESLVSTSQLLVLPLAAVPVSPPATSGSGECRFASILGAGSKVAGLATALRE